MTVKYEARCIYMDGSVFINSDDLMICFHELSERDSVNASPHAMDMLKAIHEAVLNIDRSCRKARGESTG